MERSIFAPQKCFIEPMLTTGLINQHLHHILIEWLNFIINNIDIKIDKIFYLRTMSEIAFQRIQRRARPGEELIQLNYLQNLHYLYDNWLLNENTIPVEILDGNNTPEELKQQMLNALQM